MLNKKWLLALALSVIAAPACKNSESDSGSPLCFLYGTPGRKEAQQPGKDFFESLSQMVRLRFEAKTPHECETSLKEYCQQELMRKGLSAEPLKAYFHKKPLKYHYTFEKDCAINTEIEQGSGASTSE